MAFKLRLDLNVLNHLGLGLYSSTPAIITEIVSNAWDADATKVSIRVDPDNEKIVVEDDGHGMNADEVQDKFLKVGYSRRDLEATGNKSRSGLRDVMGRKGIGKLAMLSLARDITVVTKSEVPGSEAVAFKFNVPQLLSDIKNGNEYQIPDAPVPEDFKQAKGTRIILEGLNAHINKTEKYLRPRLARRFAVLDDKDKFSVELNSRSITPDDRGYYKDIQFLWCFDNETKERVAKLATTLASIKVESTDGVEVETECVATVEDSLNLIGATEPTKLRVRGFIATVDKPAKLGEDDESINQISVFANGRVFQVDVLNEIGDARHFNQYIVGEVHADFLDDDDIDRATASREAVKHNDPKYMSLTSHLKTVLSVIRDQWDDWRVALKVDPAEKTSAAIEKWLSGLDNSVDRKYAQKLVGSISKAQFANDGKSDQNLKILLLQSAIAGFEKLRVRRQLTRLDGVKDVFSPEFMSIFTGIDDIEESYYLDITRQRLEVIEKFKDLVAGEALEKLVQQYLFKHLWLLDPTWDRITGSEEMEVPLTEYLKKADPDTDEGARVDIAYITSSARHVIVEMKRPGVKVSFDKLRAQARKYIASVQTFFEEFPDVASLDGRIPPIDVYILVSQKPKGLLQNDEISLRLDHIQFLTYSGLIINARKAYEEYFKTKQKTSRIDQVLNDLREVKVESGETAVVVDLASGDKSNLVLVAGGSA